MNQVFSFKRFGMLFKKHTVENFKGYLMSIFVLVGILTLVMGWVNYSSNHPMNVKQQYMFFMFFFWAAGTIFTSNVFVNLGDKKKSISILMLPASSVEKFLIGWIYSYVIFQILFVLIYYIVIVSILKTGSWHGQKIEIMGLFSEPEQKFLYLIYAVLHSIMLYGAIYFKRMHYIKTAFISFISVTIIWLLNLQVLRSFFKQSVTNPPLTGISFMYKNTFINMRPEHNSITWISILFLVLTVIFWFAAYFRLKEKQV